MMNNKKKKYYAVWGSNGVGIFDNWDKVQDARPYIKKFGTEKFNNWEDAERKALWEFNLFQDESCLSYFNGPLSLNYVLYKKQIKEIMQW